jgi:Cu-Zn family superoxide dismutase
MKRPVAWIALCSLLACGGAGSGDVAPAGDSAAVVADEEGAAMEPEPSVGAARAEMVDAEGRGLGAVILNENDGEVALAGALIGLPPGEHGFHIHETGTCDPPGFESAGSHVAPAGNPHGFQAAGGPHAGDLWNLVAGPDSIATVEFETSLVSLHGGDAPLLDDDGSALVVHADPDDYVSQPAGNSGARIACGVIEE